MAIDTKRLIYDQKKRARLNRVCLGHWINKGYGIRLKDCYEDSICTKCGGLEPKGAEWLNK